MSPEEVMREVRRLEISTRHLVRDIVAGEYSSAFRGRGVEFSEVREYQPGDDIRTIDWNVTARLGSAYVKRYLEERELSILFLLDVSASARFGSRLRTKQALAVALDGIMEQIDRTERIEVHVGEIRDYRELYPFFLGPALLLLGLELGLGLTWLRTVP